MATDTVGFAWWMPANGGSQQAFVKNYQGLQDAGFDVHAYTADSLAAMVDRADAFDWALVPFVFNPDWIRALAEKTHVHLQIGGYGTNDFDAARKSIRAADSVSVLDPQLAGDFRVGDKPWIPNPPNADCFDPTDSTEGYVLIPKQVPGGGLGHYREIAKSYDDETFVVCGSPFPDPPSNVRIRPKVPWSWMPQLYADAKAVVNIIGREGLPNIAFESFLTATPYVYLEPGSIGETQSADRPPIDSIGRASASVFGGVDSSIGDHIVRDIWKATPEVGRKGREWVEEWINSGWGWEAKAKAIQAVVQS